MEEKQIEQTTVEKTTVKNETENQSQQQQQDQQNIEQQKEEIQENKNLDENNQQSQKKEQTETVKYVDPNFIMQYGSMVIMYLKHDLMKQIVLTEGAEEGTSFGHIPHSHFVGKQFGSKICAKGKGGYVVALKPNPNLITSSLKHKTQIIYQSDISFILFKLNILPGSKVIETGTGSGSLSCAILTTIQETGHLYTFEFSLERVLNARKLFQDFQFKNVDVIHRDTQTNGFTNGEGQNFDVFNADAVFLDLPAPFKAIGHSKAVLKRGGKLACYSPCIEQCQKNVVEIWNQGFTNVHTMEVVHRVQDRQKHEFKSHFDSKNLNVKRYREEIMDINPNNGNEKGYIKQSAQFTQSSGRSFGHTAYLTFATLI